MDQNGYHYRQSYCVQNRAIIDLGLRDNKEIGTIEPGGKFVPSSGFDSNLSADERKAFLSDAGQKQLKDKTLDEKLQLLSEIPVNNTSGIFVDTPGVTTPERTEEGDLPAGEGLNLTQDDSATDTTGLFMEDGTIRSVEPPGDASYVLGPMISMWYAWANYTQIGYVRQSDRKMVNLGRITGEMSDWDGETGFTSYGQLSLEQAVWYKEQTRQDYRAFYPGPPSNPADTYGRYIGSIVAVPKQTTYQPPTYWAPGTQRGFNATDNLALMAQVDPAAQIAITFVLMVFGFGAALINTIINSLSPEQKEELFDQNFSFLTIFLPYLKKMFKFSFWRFEFC